MEKLKKRIILCGFLTLFASANVIVAVSNEKQKSLFSVREAEAQAFGFESSILNWLEDLLLNSNTVVYKYNTREGLTCSPVQIFSGRYYNGSSQAQNLDAHLGLTGSVTYATGNVNGDAGVNYQAQKQSMNTYQYEYTVDISLGGNDWMIKTCEPCSNNDPEKIGKNCNTYNECAEAIKSSAGAYREALGLS